MTGEPRRSARGNLADALARAGDYSGWLFVRSEILDSGASDTNFRLALIWASAFEGMPGVYGPRLTLAHELHQLLPLLPTRRQDVVQREIIRAQSAVAPGPKPQ